jgi:cardiolipin synthase
MIALANALTLSRIPLGLAFWLAARNPPWAIAVLVIGAFTDVIDGAIARRGRRQKGVAEAGPGIGAWLDPLCDKFFVISVLLATYVVKQIPATMIAAIAAREIILVPLAAVYRLSPGLRTRIRYDFTAGPLGKAATVAQVIAIIAILTDRAVLWPLAAIAGAVGLAAAVAYIARGLRLARQAPAARAR